MCGKEFTASRKDAKYCSTQCGQKAYQQVKRENNTDEDLITTNNDNSLGAIPKPTSVPQPSEKKQVDKSIFANLFNDDLPQKKPSEREMQKMLIKEAFRELIKEELSKQQKTTNITVKHEETPLNWLNLVATGVNVAMNKSDNNNIQKKLDAIIQNQNTIVANQNSIFKLINSVLMDVKALKRVCKIFHITAEYSPKYKSYLFCYRQGDYVVKEDVNGNIIEQIPIPKK